MSEPVPTGADTREAVAAAQSHDYHLHDRAPAVAAEEWKERHRVALDVVAELNERLLAAESSLVAERTRSERLQKALRVTETILEDPANPVPPSSLTVKVLAELHHSALHVIRLALCGGDDAR